MTNIGSNAFYNCYKLIEVYNLSSLNITKGSNNNGYVGYYALDVYTSKESTSKLHNVDDYILYEDGDTVYLMGYIGNQTELTLPDKYNNKNYAVYQYAFNNCSCLTSVTIGNNVTGIGSYAFYGCSNLDSITLPFVGATNDGSGNTYFGYIFGADSYSSNNNYVPNSLKTVIIMGGKSIKTRAFYGCSSLTRVTIGNDVTSIESSAFYGCSSLESITLPFVGATKDGNGNTHFGYIFGADSYSSNSYYVPDSLKTVIITGGTSIGRYVFFGCSNLTSIIIPDSVTSIGYAAFIGCSNLTSITIPEMVTSIGDYAFNDCCKLIEVYNLSGLNITKGSYTNGSVGLYALDIYTSNESASKLHTIDDYIFYEDGDIVYLIEYFGTQKQLVLPDKYNNKSYAIHQYAFYNCSSLISIIIGDSVTSIGYSAFFGCSKLTSVTIGKNVTSIGYCAFEDCSSLTSITIPDSMTNIGGNAFYNCSSLESVTIGKNVTSIDYCAFYECNSLENVYYGGTSMEWHNISIDSYNTSLTSATIYCYSVTQPTEDGNYWHYDEDGVTPIIWTKKN